jgi:hypothetical protein
MIIQIVKVFKVVLQTLIAHIVLKDVVQMIVPNLARNLDRRVQNPVPHVKRIAAGKAIAVTVLGTKHPPTYHVMFHSLE